MLSNISEGGLRWALCVRELRIERDEEIYTASNRLRTINNKISLADLNDSMTTFKIKMKRLFLSLDNGWRMNNQ